MKPLINIKCKYVIHKLTLIKQKSNSRRIHIVNHPEPSLVVMQGCQDGDVFWVFREKPTSSQSQTILPSLDYLVRVWDVFLGFGKKSCTINCTSYTKCSQPRMASFLTPVTQRKPGHAGFQSVYGLEDSTKQSVWVWEDKLYCMEGKQ